MYQGYKQRRRKKNNREQSNRSSFLLAFCDFFFFCSVESLRQVQLSISPTRDRNLSWCFCLLTNQSEFSLFLLVAPSTSWQAKRPFALALPLRHSRTHSLRFHRAHARKRTGEEEEEREREREKRGREFIKWDQASSDRRQPFLCLFIFIFADRFHHAEQACLSVDGPSRNVAHLRHILIPHGSGSNRSDNQPSVHSGENCPSAWRCSSSSVLPHGVDLQGNACLVHLSIRCTGESRLITTLGNRSTEIRDDQILLILFLMRIISLFK